MAYLIDWQNSSLQHSKNKLTISEAPNILTIALKRYQIPLTIIGYFLTLMYHVLSINSFLVRLARMSVSRALEFDSIHVQNRLARTSEPAQYNTIAESSLNIYLLYSIITSSFDQFCQLEHVRPTDLINLLVTWSGTKIQHNGEWSAGDLHVARVQHKGKLQLTFQPSLLYFQLSCVYRELEKYLEQNY